MMSEETAQRVAVALERIADRLERGQGAGGASTPLIPAWGCPVGLPVVPGGGAGDAPARMYGGAA